MKYKKTLLSALKIALFSVLIIKSFGCRKEWFDIKSNSNLTVPNTLQDLELLLDDYTTMSSFSPGLGEVACGDHYILESTWESFQSNDPLSNNLRNAYTWTYSNPFTQVSDWNNCYKRIFYCNLVLNALDKIDLASIDVNKLNSIKGNALFHRAKNYYELAQIFAQPYSSTTNSPFGLPIKKDVDVTELPKRSSVYETYQFIIDDLMMASEILTTKPLIPSRASKSSCWALISRIYLLIGNYNNALKYSNLTLSQYDKLIDLNAVPNNSVTLGLFNTEVIFHTKMMNYSFILPARSFVNPEIIGYYETNDLRKTKFFKRSNDRYSYKGMYSENAIPFTGLATDEIYLIRSEANARLDQLQLALKDINLLRESRWKKDENGVTLYQDTIISNKSELIKFILIERRKELIYRGLRWSDLRRLNSDHNYAETIIRKIGGNEYSLEPNSYKYTFPIPDDEISLNYITQNPGWNK